VVTHPIQHFCPQYTSWAALDGVDLRVFFASRDGLDTYSDPDLARPVRWDELVLDFPHEFLAGAEHRHVTEALDAAALAHRLTAFRPDCLCVHGYSQPLARRAIGWARTAGAPVLMVGDSELRRKRPWARRAVKTLLLPRILNRVDRFLTVGDANEAYYRRYGVTDERFVRCGFPIDVTLYDRVLGRRDRARAAVREEHGIPDHHQVLLMVGKLVASKRQRDLVAFSNHVRRLRDDVTIVLAGAGPKEQQLRDLDRRGPGGVVFAGFVPPAALPRYYCASDLYVHCAAVDAHPLAVTEAVYCGLPAVVSDRCGSYGPTDDVRIGLNGRVYRCGDAGALASAVLGVLDSPPARRRAMAAASARIGRGVQRLAHGQGLLQALDSLALRPEASRPDGRTSEAP
jgi:glycosyltransferase involved in cell wall biosynthesis